MKLAHHQEAEADRLLAFADWKTKTSLTRTSKWVKGHQDDVKLDTELTELGRLNIVMDKSAAVA